MSAEVNKQLVRRCYEDVVNTGRVDLLPQFIAPGYVEVFNNLVWSTGALSSTAARRTC